MASCMLKKSEKKARIGRKEPGCGFLSATVQYKWQVLPAGSSLAVLKGKKNSHKMC